MDISIEVCRSDQEFAAIVDKVLIPTFPAEELGQRQWLLDAYNAGYYDTVIAWQTPQQSASSHGDRTPVGAAVGWRMKDDSDLIVLNWFAVSQSTRGAGIGGRLLTAALTRWEDEYRPLAIVGEVEDPRVHPASAAGGDPVARIRFYRRWGAMPIDTYFAMPRLAPDVDAVDDMFLIALAGPIVRDPSCCDERFGKAINRFLRGYVAECPWERNEDGSYRPEIVRMLREAHSASIGDWDTMLPDISLRGKNDGDGDLGK